MPSPPSETFAQARTILDARPNPVTSIAPALGSKGAASMEDVGFAQRYEEQELLGEGGMGVVRLYRDARIGRDVAMKTIRAERGARMDIQARFLREARVQGQLEHPSIVPVYDVSSGPDGAAYFTMKRVRGLTLADIFDGLRARDPLAEKNYSLRKLLAAFGSVCLAVEFAHARSVIHRDLKPGNVMLGDFGEVYVLDWGIAKILHETGDAVAARALPDADATGPIELEDGLTTQLGTILGTLGYLSPEQLQNLEIDARSDVYALGAILFEMLTLVPLHDGAVPKIFASTVKGADARCSVRVPERDVPPELEEICVKATRTAAKDRFASARALYEAVQKYLDGDRDAERRRTLAAEHVDVAMAALEAPANDASRVTANRALALTELGRSVALDPSNDAAIGGIVRLLVEPPRVIPEEVRAQVVASHASSMREVNATGIVGNTGGLAAFVPLMLWMGVKQWASAGLLVFFLAAALVGCLLYRRRPSIVTSYAVSVFSALALAVMSRIVGPIVLVPTLSMGIAMVCAMYPVRHLRRSAVALMFLATLGPLALEWVHLLPASYAFRDGQMIVIPQVCALPPAATTALLTVAPLLTLLIGALGIFRIRDALTAAEERLALQAWQFRQLVPERARHRV